MQGAGHGTSMRQDGGKWQAGGAAQEGEPGWAGTCCSCQSADSCLHGGRADNLPAVPTAPPVCQPAWCVSQPSSI